MNSKRLTVFASGTGSNFKALHQAVLNHEIPACITALVCDNPEAGALQYARSHKIRTHLIIPSNFPDRQSYEKKLESVLVDEAPDLIILAGYLKKIPDRIVDIFPQRIINIHPALLPAYGGKGWYGLRVHRAVIDNRDKLSGCTIHFVSKIYDDGPIIAWATVPVYTGDTPESLAERVQQQEHILYPKVVQQLLTRNTTLTNKTDQPDHNDHDKKNYHDDNLNQSDHNNETDRDDQNDHNTKS